MKLVTKLLPLIFKTVLLWSIFLVGIYLFTSLSLASQTCTRCSNQRGCSLATFQSDDGCQNPIAGPTPSYSKLDTCGPNVIDGADNTWCTVPMGPTCTRCSNKVGCTMATFQSNDNCYNPLPNTTPSYAPNTNPCGPVPATPDNPTPNNDNCTTTVLPPTQAPVPTLTMCAARCSKTKGCAMLTHDFPISNNDCANPIPNPALTDADYRDDVTCELQHQGQDTRCEAVCPNLSKIDGKDNVKIPITVLATNTYTIMTQMFSQGYSNAFYVQIDKNCPVIVGNSSAIPLNQWVWVDYLNGDSNSKFTASLSTGSHTITYIPFEPGIKISRVLVVDHTCTPDIMGNCMLPAVPTQPPPTPIYYPPPQPPAPKIVSVSSMSIPVTATPVPTATPTPLVVVPPELTFEGKNGSIANTVWGQTVSGKVGQTVMLRWFVKNANRCDANYSPLTPYSSWTGPQLASIYEKQKYLQVASTPPTRVLYLKCYNSATPTVFTQKSVSVNVIQ